MEQEIQAMRAEHIKRLAQHNSQSMFDFGGSPSRINPDIERAGGTPGAYETAPGNDRAPTTPGPEGHEPFTSNFEDFGLNIH